MAKRENNPISYSDIVSFKWGKPLLDVGFVPLPKRLMRCLTEVFKGKLRMSELSAVLAIVDFQRPQVSRLPSLLHLANMAGLSESRFRRCLHSLASRGLVTWSGTEEAMEFDYTGLTKKIMKLTGTPEDKKEE
jgi:hypothetical protein